MRQRHLSLIATLIVFMVLGVSRGFAQDTPSGDSRANSIAIPITVTEQGEVYVGTFSTDDLREMGVIAALPPRIVDAVRRGQEFSLTGNADVVLLSAGNQEVAEVRWNTEQRRTLLAHTLPVAELPSDDTTFQAVERWLTGSTFALEVRRAETPTPLRFWLEQPLYVEVNDDGGLILEGFELPYRVEARLVDMLTEAGIQDIGACWRHDTIALESGGERLPAIQVTNQLLSQAGEEAGVTLPDYTLEALEQVQVPLQVVLPPHEQALPLTGATMCEHGFSPREARLALPTTRLNGQRDGSMLDQLRSQLRANDSMLLQVESGGRLSVTADDSELGALLFDPPSLYRTGAMLYDVGAPPVAKRVLRALGWLYPTARSDLAITLWSLYYLLPVEMQVEVVFLD